MFRDDPNALSSRRRKLYQQLERLDFRDEPHLTEDAYGRHLERSLSRSRFPLLWILPFILGAIGLYAAFRTVLSTQASQILRIGS